MTEVAQPTSPSIAKSPPKAIPWATLFAFVLKGGGMLNINRTGVRLIRGQFGEEACNLFRFMPVRQSVFYTNPHSTVMKNFNLWAFVLVVSIGLCSCALSYPYCDAYNGVEFEQGPTEVNPVSDDAQIAP